MAWDTLLWDWGAMGRMFLSAGAATACVQLLNPVIRDRRQSRRHAAYMAMRLAVALEAYSEGCADLVQRNAREAPRRNEEPSARTMALPTPPHYPEDLDGWKAIDHTLADRCLSFESRTRQSQAIIASIIGDGRRLAGELETQAIERGLEAWDLAVELRKRHRLRPIDPVWNYADDLRARKAKRRSDPQWLSA